MSKESSKRCLKWVNIILLILSILVLGFSLFVQFYEETPISSLLSPYLYTMTVVGGIIGIYAVLGLCASCEGCWLWVYGIVVTILFVVSILATIALFFVYFTTSDNNESSEIIEELDSYALLFISEHEDEWVQIQNNIECCGYKAEYKTGSFCTNPDISDCRDVILSFFSTSTLGSTIAFVVIMILLGINSIASCRLMCSNK